MAFSHSAVHIREGGGAEGICQYSTRYVGWQRVAGGREEEDECNTYTGEVKCSWVWLSIWYTAKGKPSSSSKGLLPPPPARK
jgi:hypothetical protein